MGKCQTHVLFVPLWVEHSKNKILGNPTWLTNFSKQLDGLSRAQEILEPKMMLQRRVELRFVVRLWFDIFKTNDKISLADWFWDLSDAPCSPYPAVLTFPGRFSKMSGFSLRPWTCGKSGNRALKKTPNSEVKHGRNTEKIRKTYFLWR